MSQILDTEFKGLDIRIEFNVEREEQATPTYPGCPPALEIIGIWITVPDDLVDLLLSGIEEVCWESLRDQEKARAESLAQDYLEGRFG